MAIKTLNTRIQLKYDTLGNWSTKNPQLLSGELAIVSLGNTVDVNKPNPDNGTHPILFKVGPGNFNDLPFASALAADVYAWAKSKEIIADGSGNAVTGVTVRANADGTSSVVLNKGETFATAAQLSDLSGRVDAIDTDTDTRYSFEKVDVKTDENYGKLKITAQRYNVKTSANIGDPVYSYVDLVTPQELTDILTSYYTKDEIDDLLEDIGEQIDTIDTGVHSVTLTGGTNNGTLKLTVDNVPTDNIAVTGLQDAAYTTVAALNETAKGYADAVEGKFDAYDTAHTNDYTNAQIDSLIAGAKQYADDNDANTEYHVEYDATAKKIKLVAGADAAKMEIDAADFIKDGMLQSVELVQEDAEGNKGQFLKLTWNDDGNDVTYVSVGALVDVYTAAKNATEVQVAISNTNEVSATLVNGGVAKAKLATSVQTSLDKADSALQASDIAGLVNDQHTHSNKALLDTYTQTEANLADAVSKKHNHTNKDVLDGITSAKVTAWDTIASLKISESTWDGTQTMGSGNYLRIVEKAEVPNLEISKHLAKAADMADKVLAYVDIESTSTDYMTVGDKEGYRGSSKEVDPSQAIGLTASAKAGIDAGKTAVQTITTKCSHADHTHTNTCGGLKAVKTGTEVNIEIDDSITFIFNCGSATELV